MTTTGTQPAQQTFTVPADLKQLPLIRSVVRDVCTTMEPGDCGCPEFRRALAELELAVTELVSNVIRHGLDGVTNGRLQIQTEASEDSLFSLTVTHNGRAFDGNAADIKEITDPQEGGMGLYLISQCVDQVTYGTTDDGSPTIHLTRRFHFNKGE